MQTIETRYLPATNFKGARITAQASGNKKRITVPYRYDGPDDAEHITAALALCEALGWSGKLIGGHLKHGMVWVFASSNSPTFTAKNPTP
jgi:hypothetical protein